VVRSRLEKEGSVEFRILGPLEVAENGGSIGLGAAKQQTLLGVLLLQPNEVVPMTRLVDELWGEAPPATAAKVVQGHVSELRKILGNTVLVTKARGYLAAVDPDRLDSIRFQRLAAEGHDSIESDPERAAARLRQALALWRGDVLQGLELRGHAQAEARGLDEQRLVVLEERIEADLALGRHASLVGELGRLVAAHPYSERLRAHLMIALYRSGRQAEALAVYRDTRRLLAEELGLEPGAELQRLEQLVLTQAPELDTPRRPVALLAPFDSAQPRAAHALHANASSFVEHDARLAEPTHSALARPRRRKGFLAAALVGVLAAAAAVPIFVLASGDPGTGPVTDRLAPGSVAVIDAATGRLIRNVPTGAPTARVTAGERFVWVTHPWNRTVTRIDPRTFETRTFGVASEPVEATAGAGALWIAHPDGTISWVTGDHTGDHIERFRIAGSKTFVGGLAFGAGSLWTATYGNDSRFAVLRINPKTRKVVARISFGFASVISVNSLAFGYGSVWVTGVQDQLLRIDPATNAVLDRIPVTDIMGVAVGEGAAWGLVSGEDTVWRINPGWNRATRTIDVNRRPSGLAVGAGSVWVGSQDDGTILRIDPDSGRVVQRIRFSARRKNLLAGASLAIGHGYVWASLFG
jgi:DNA-binding SARP family transcriptional activator/DNA-binding beta-propeller fold protein YncE